MKTSKFFSSYTVFLFFLFSSCYSNYLYLGSVSGNSHKLNLEIFSAKEDSLGNTLSIGLKYTNLSSGNFLFNNSTCLHDGYAGNVEINVWDNNNSKKYLKSLFSRNCEWNNFVFLESQKSVISTIDTFTPIYMYSLPAGEYTIQIAYYNKVIKKDKSTESWVGSLQSNKLKIKVVGKPDISKTNASK